MIKLMRMGTHPKTLEDRFDKAQLAKALAGALLILQHMECPNCGETMEAHLESTTEEGGEPRSGGTDQVVGE